MTDVVKVIAGPTPVIHVSQPTSAQVIKVPAAVPATALIVSGGQKGDSAYTVAVKNGFVGTEQDWLDSLLVGGTVQSVNGAIGVVVLTQDDVGDGTTYKRYSLTDKTKLAGVATGATANQTDAYLLARVNHTGTQPSSTISDFTTAVDARISNVIGAAPAALDTLAELAAALGNDANFAATVTTSLAGKEPTIAGGTTAQYWRGDKSWQTLNKTAVGLANVDNTSDSNKPVSTAQQTALDLKAPLASPTFTGTVAGITKSMVGLGNVANVDTTNADNISDGTTNKLLTATERTKLTGIATGATANSSDAALLARANHTGTQLSSTISDFSEAVDDRVAALLVQGTGITLTYNDVANTLTVAATSSGVAWGAITGTLSSQTDLDTALGLKAPLASPTFTGTVSGITAAMVGLGNVDNTSDATKNAATVTLANKTLNNTNTLNIKDTLFTLQDNGDATKQIQFELAGITTGNTRTLTVPDASDTLVLLAATQTLTNKTLDTASGNVFKMNGMLLSAGAGTGTIFFPTTNGSQTLATRAGAETLTSKTLTTPIIGGATITDATDIVLGTTTGTKIGTATTQKLGFFNAAPVTQPQAATDLGTVLANLGLRVAGTSYPITTAGALTLTGATQVTDTGFVIRASGDLTKKIAFDSSGITTGTTRTFTVPDVSGTIQLIGATQTITNKTYDNTNTYTTKDTLFTLQDDGDTTKQLRFQLSGITTGTIRTLTIPDVSDTLVTLAATQTLTNKSLTSSQITDFATAAPQATMAGGNLNSLNWYMIPHWSVTTVAFAANQCIYVPWYIGWQCTLDAVGFEVTVAGVGGTPTVRVGVYASGADGNPGTLIKDCGQVAVTATGAKTTTTGQAIAITPGWIWFAFAAQGATTTQPTLRALANGPQLPTMNTQSTTVSASASALNSLTSNSISAGFASTPACIFAGVNMPRVQIKPLSVP